MGVYLKKQNHKLLDYQLSDFLELKLGIKQQSLISELRRKFLKASALRGSNLYEFPAIGTANVCLILSNGRTEKLKQIFLLDSAGSIKTISVR